MSTQNVNTRLTAIRDRVASSPHLGDKDRRPLIIFVTDIANPYPGILQSKTLDALVNPEIAENIARTAGFASLSSMRCAVDLGLSVSFEVVEVKKGEPVLDAKGNPAKNARTGQPYGVYLQDSVRFNNVEVHKSFELAMKLVEIKETAAATVELSQRLKTTQPVFQVPAFGTVPIVQTEGAKNQEQETIVAEEEQPIVDVNELENRG